jgi:Holliday junction resolvasome RuvABC endonuclease subunit
VIPLLSTRLLRTAATLAAAAALSACVGYAPEATTGTILGARSAERTQVRDRVVCEYDPVYGRDGCYRN